MRITLEKIHDSNKEFVYQHFGWLDNDDRKPVCSIGPIFSEDALNDKCIKYPVYIDATPEARMAYEFKKFRHDKEVAHVKKFIGRKYRWQKLKLWFLRRKEELARLKRAADYEICVEAGEPLEREMQMYFLKRYRLIKVGVPMEQMENMTYQQFMNSQVRTSFQQVNYYEQILIQDDPVVDGQDFTMVKDETN
jgi:hypothetical protein